MEARSGVQESGGNAKSERPELLTVAPDAGHVLKDKLKASEVWKKHGLMGH